MLHLASVSPCTFTCYGLWQYDRDPEIWSAGDTICIPASSKYAGDNVSCSVCLRLNIDLRAI